MIASLYLNQDRIDLYGDESISVISSVLDIQDILKNNTEYTQSFTVPASPNNNRIFKHYYNHDIEAFDGRTAVSGARIELSGLIFRTGKLTLTKVNMKKGQPSSYMLNFYGHLLSFKDLLGEDKLSVLSFPEYDHLYDSNWIKSLLTGTAASDDLIVPLLAPRRYIYASNSDAYDPEKIENIYFGGLTTNGIKHGELVPALKLSKIIDKIQSHYGFTFSGTLFSKDIFDKLYLWLYIGGQVGLATKTLITYDVPKLWEPGLKTEGIVSQGTYLEQFLNNGNFYRSSFIVTPDTGFESVTYKVKVYRRKDNYETLIKTFEDLTGTTTSVIDMSYAAGDRGYMYLKFYVEITSDFTFTPTIQYRKIRISDNTVLLYENHKNDSTTSLTPKFRVSETMPDIKVIDFIKGLIQAFKAVIIPGEDSVYVSPVNEYYAEGKVWNLTKYIDQKSYPIEPGRILNTIKYRFQDPQTILNIEFQNQNTHAYGDEILYLYDEEAKLLNGDVLDIQLPFEQIVYERLRDLEDSVYTNVVVGTVADSDLGAVTPKPHIFYPVLRAIGSKHLAFQGDSGQEELTGNIYCPSHVESDADFGIGFIFSQELDEYNLTVIRDNLYTIYHKDYIEGIFDIRRRVVNVTAFQLPIGWLNDIRLNDVIMIGSNYYRINKFTTDIVKDSIKFELFTIKTLGLNT